MSSPPAAAPAAASSAAPVPDECDLAVVGGGILGLAVARELGRRHPRARLCVLEREPDLACHQTGHDSGWCTQGIYYEPGSLKARLCVAGARELYEFCEERGIAHERCGKVIVATNASELPRLEELERRGRANGVPGLRRLRRSTSPSSSRMCAPSTACTRPRPASSTFPPSCARWPTTCARRAAA